MKNALTLTTSKVLSFGKIQINLVFRSLNRTFADAMSDKKQGLSAAEVSISRLEHGENVLTPPRRQSMWRLYLEKYQDPMVRILLVAAMVSLVLSFVKNDYVETIGIIAAVILATTVGFYFERDAARKFDVLTQLGEEQRVKVVREGHIMEIPRREVVVGDIVIVETGDEVPADGKLFEATDLQVDESSLTGEMLTTKSLDSQKVSAYPSDQLLRSSMVMNGTGRYVVTAVGDETEIGHVARQATEITGVKTPLNLQLERLAKLISKVGSGVSIAAFVVFLVHDVLTQPLWHTTDYVGMIEVVLKYFMMAVTLIVMAVPEGLPMAVTLALALNMRRMLKSNNLVRKLQASETMGAVTCICTDKTGTLTENRMTVSQMRNEFATPHSDQSEKGEMRNATPELAKAIALNTTATHDVGNPTEQALLRWLQEQGVDYQQLRNDYPLTSRLPFSTERKYMSTTIGDTRGGDGYVRPDTRRARNSPAAVAGVATACYAHTSYCTGQDIAGHCSYQRPTAKGGSCGYPPMRTGRDRREDCDGRHSSDRYGDSPPDGSVKRTVRK